MVVKVYRSTDVGAPKRTGALGSDIAILKACLVNGYGSVAGAGWTNPYNGTNLAVFRQGGGNQRYLRVDDSKSAYPYASIYRGYESMSAISTGIAPMPSSVAGVALARSSGGDTVADRPWTIVATDKAFYFFAATDQGELERSYPQIMFFGDIQSFVPGDQYATALIGNDLTNGYSSTQYLPNLTTGTNSLIAGHYIGRKFDQVGGPVQFGKHSDMGKLGGATMGVGNMQYPNPADGGFYLAPVWVHEVGASSGQGVLRGLMPGLWSHCHPVNAARLHDQVPGTGAMAGKTLEFFTFGSSGDSASIGIEISDTW